MAQPIDDRWLWLGLGIAAFIAVRGMRRSIQDTVRLIEVPNPTERNNDDRSEEGSLSESQYLHVSAARFARLIPNQRFRLTRSKPLPIPPIT